MRTRVVVATLVVLTALVSVLSTSGAARPAPACADLKGNGACPGIVCVDENLNGRFEWHECIEMHCPHGCCYGRPCPPPDWD